VIHGHSSTAMTLGAGLFSFLTRIPLIVEVQDLMAISWLIKIGRVKKYIATGTVIKNQLVSFGIRQDKILRIFSLPPEILIDHLGQGPDDRMMIFVGELNRKIKGADVLLEAARKLNTVFNNFLLVMVGDGPDRSYVENYIKNNHLGKQVILRGPLSARQCLKAISQSSFLILPSLNEGMPRVIIEAFSLGRPVVASRVGGIPEIVIDQKNGLLVEPGRADQLSRAMQVLLENHELRDRLAAEAKNFAEQLPSWSSIAEAILNIYNN
jgi:glycosyltransferase involved in cell wall biosynthesis